MKKNIVVLLVGLFMSCSNLFAMNNADKRLFNARNLLDVQSASRAGASVNLDNWLLTDWLMRADVQAKINFFELRNMFEFVLKHGRDIAKEPKLRALINSFDDEGMSDPLNFKRFATEVLDYEAASDKITFLKTLKNPNYDLYLHRALHNGKGKVVGYISEQTKQTPFDILNVIMSNFSLPVTMVPYLLYSLQLSLEDLKFLGVVDAAKNAAATTDNAKNLLLLYRLAKENGSKAFGKAMLDYYSLLQKYGDSNAIPPEVAREIFSFLDPKVIDAIITKPETKIREEETIDCGDSGEELEEDIIIEI